MENASISYKRRILRIMKHRHAETNKQAARLRTLNAARMQEIRSIQKEIKEMEKVGKQ